jgi:hypothetical protein
MQGWSKEQLQEEIDYETFLKELDQMKAWISHRPRRRISWLFSMQEWVGGNH